MDILTAVIQYCNYANHRLLSICQCIRIRTYITKASLGSIITKMCWKKCIKWCISLVSIQNPHNEKLLSANNYKQIESTKF
jgi:hypothetical protein